MDHVDVIERLLARGHTQAGLERALRLSPNYLSKLRHRAAKPSFQLSALLAVLERHPETLATIEATPQPVAPAPSPSVPRPPYSALDDLLSLAPTLEAANVRHGLLGLGAHVEDNGDVDLVVHDADRHVLPALREAGFVCAHHASNLFRCRREDALIDEAFTLHFPTTPPLVDALATAERKTIRGVTVRAIGARETALWFLLNRREDGLDRARRLVDVGAVDHSALLSALDDLRALPPTRSPYVLQTFDRDLAALRLARLGSA